MATIHHQPASLDAALAMLPSLPRPLLSRLVARAIERLDEIDGDTDVEPDGDEEDGSFAEEEERAFATQFAGPGCSISDVDERRS